MAAASLDAVLDRAIATGTLAGAVVAVAARGKPVYLRAAGDLDREAGREMPSDAIFRLASVTKPIVTVAAFGLAEDGAFTLDAPVTDFLPDFQPRLRNGDPAAITLRHLLGHTAGLYYRFLGIGGGAYDRAEVSDGLDQPGLSLEENLRRLASVPLLFAPGSSWCYSMATDVLAAVLSRVTGMSLPDLIGARIGSPLDWRDTGFGVSDSSRLAVPYADGEGGAPVRMGRYHEVPVGKGFLRYVPDRYLDPKSYPSGGSALNGTATDLLAFFEAVRTHRLLSKESLTLMTRDILGDSPLPDAPPGWGFGLGVAVLKDRVPSGTPQANGSFGWGGAYGHTWFVDPVNELTVVSLTNTAVAGMQGWFPEAVRDAAYDLLA
ncbi:serine hydrolase domain-containing protein [Lacibacterium aquatile]|uniref:Serine hydrolase domain-containing protein n=1 Tax=Lacibacterium aquatile TaxID=1168082 RepID=A0ABW5DNL9_9PROT